jgi:hypothetical protein
MSFDFAQDHPVRFRGLPDVAFMRSLVEHLENSSPLIFEEIARWRDLLWDDYIDYKREEDRRKKIVVP